MRNHETGKRVAPRRPLPTRRLLSLLMALVMSLSLVQITALAGETTQDPRITHQGEERKDDMATVKKTVKHVDGDKFEITLSVTVKKTEETTVTNNPAHIVLVMDRSNSMKDNPGRFDNARTAAQTFAAALLKGNDANNDNGNRIAVVGFGTEADKNRNRGGFSGDLKTVNSWIESATKAYKDNNDGGTNIQAGIHEAQRLLDNDKNFTGKKIIVVFSDGEPTYSYRYVNTAEVTKCHTEGILFPHHVVDEYKLTGTWHFDYNDRVGSGSSYGYRDTWDVNDYPYASYACTKHWIRDGYITIKDKSIFRAGATGDATNGDATIAEAMIAQAAGTEIYSVYLGGSDEEQDKNALETMRGIVNDVNKNFLTTNNMADLAKLFGQIAQTITTETSGLTVSDPMGNFILLGNVKELVDAGVIVLAEDGRSFTWILSETPAANVTKDEQANTTTYTITYPITLDTANERFVSGNYPTNGKTVLTYYINDSTTPNTLEFDVPVINGTKPEPDPTYTLTVKYQDEDGNTIKADTQVANAAGSTAWVKGSAYEINVNGTDYPTTITVDGVDYEYKQPAENSAPLTGTIVDDTTVILVYAKTTPVDPELVTYTVEYYLQKSYGYDKETPDYTVNGKQEKVGKIEIKDLYAAGFGNVPTGYVLDRETLEFGGVEPGEHEFTDKQVFKLFYKLAEVEPANVTYTVNYFLEKDYGYNKFAPDYTVNGEQEKVGKIEIKDLYAAGFENVPDGYVLDRETLDFNGVEPGEYTFSDGQVFNLYYKLAEVEPEMVTYKVNYYLALGGDVGYPKDPQ